MKLPRHRHKPLSSEGSIRVVDVLPGTKEVPRMQCKLREVALDSSDLQYEALSYVWGDPNETHTIVCDDQALRVTVDCWWALHYLRHEDRVRTLWVDAICIDQSCDQEGSVQERNHQIKLMGSVYKNASCVLAWLGEGIEYMPEAFELCELAQRLPENYQQLSYTDPTTKLIHERLEVMYRNNYILSSFWTLVESPWFFRMWTVQEIAFASKAFLIFESHSLDWNAFLRGYDYLAMHTPLGMMDHIQINLRRDTIRYIRQSHTTFNIPSLRVIRDLQCTRPHDKIYGMYAILSSLGIPLEDPDYTQPVTQLINRTTLSLIQHYRSLSFIMLTLPASRNTGQASWAPDWLTPSNTDHTLVDCSGVFARGDDCSFHASKNTKHDRVHDVKFGEYLTATGKHIGRIGEMMTVSPLDKGRDSVDNMNGFKDMISICMQWCQYMLHHGTQLSGNLAPTHATRLALLFVGEIIKDYPHEELEASFDRWFMLMTEPRISLTFEEALNAMGSLIERSKESVLLDEGSELPSVDVLGAMLDEWKNDDNLTLITNLLDNRYNSEAKGERAIQMNANMSVEYAFIHLDSGYIGRAHYTCQEGDEVWLLAGADKPVVLRRQEEESTFQVVAPAFRVVAPAFIVGAMDGELWPDEGNIDDLENIAFV